MVAQRYYHLQQDVHRPAKQVENEVLPSEYQLGRKLLSSSLINDQLLFSVTYFCYNQEKNLCYHCGDSIEVFLG